MQKAIKINGGYAVIEYYEAAQPIGNIVNGKPSQFEKFLSVTKLTLYAKDLNTGNTVPIGIEPFQLQELADKLKDIQSEHQPITEEEFINFQQ